MTKAFEFYKQSKDDDNFFAISRGETDKRTTLWHYVKECKLVYDPRSQSSHYEPAWVYIGIISDKEANNELSHIKRDRSLVGESWGNGLRFSKEEKRESKDCTDNAKSLIDSVLNRLSKRKRFVDEWGNKW